MKNRKEFEVSVLPGDVGKGDEDAASVYFDFSPGGQRTLVDSSRDIPVLIS